MLEDLGLSLVAVRVASIKPSTDVERALEAPTRERIQEEADEATFRRRAQAVDKERAIAENELQNQIELARREQQLIEQRGQNARKEAGEKAEAARIDAEAKAERTRIHSDAEAGGIRAVDGAHMSLERERMEAYKGLPSAVLATLAARELAGKLPAIEHLNITPDLIGPLLTGLLEAGTRRLETEREAAVITPRAVVVTRPTEYEGLLARHGTREQARYFLAGRGQALEAIEERHARRDRALQLVSAAVPLRWRRTRVDRADLSRFVFGPEDVVVVVGQDGLVANVAKYLTGQAGAGRQSRSRSNTTACCAGIAPRRRPTCWRRRRAAARASRRAPWSRRGLDDGQTLLALNEIFVGHRTHQSARYRAGGGGAAQEEEQTLVGRHRGDRARARRAGRARSPARSRRRCALPAPTERRLAFFVREPFPSRATGTAIEQGTLAEGEALTVVSEMNELRDRVRRRHRGRSTGARLGDAAAGGAGAGAAQPDCGLTGGARSNMVARMDEEARFLAGYDASAFERLSVAVDVALISALDGELHTLLVRRREHPHKDRWALPGGFVRPEGSRRRGGGARAGATRRRCSACSWSSSTRSASPIAIRARAWCRSRITRWSTTRASPRPRREGRRRADAAHSRPVAGGSGRGGAGHRRSRPGAAARVRPRRGAGRRREAAARQARLRAHRLPVAG